MRRYYLVIAVLSLLGMTSASSAQFRIPAPNSGGGDRSAPVGGNVGRSLLPAPSGGSSSNFRPSPINGAANSGFRPPQIGGNSSNRNQPTIITGGGSVSSRPNPIASGTSPLNGNRNNIPSLGSGNRNGLTVTTDSASAYRPPNRTGTGPAPLNGLTGNRNNLPSLGAGNRTGAAATTTNGLASNRNNLPSLGSGNRIGTGSTSLNGLAANRNNLPTLGASNPQRLGNTGLALNGIGGGRLGTGNPISGRPTAKYVLPPRANTLLSQLMSGGNLDANTNAAIQRALRGEQLSDAERNLLSAQSGNGALPAAYRGAIATALQMDLDEKQQMAANTGLGGLFNSQTLPSILGGLQSAIVPQPIFPDPGPFVVQPEPVVQPGPVVVQPGPVVVQQGSVQGAGQSSNNLTGGSDIEPVVNQEWGLKVTEVGANGPADRASLKAGQIIVSVGGRRVQSFEELATALAQASGEIELVVYDPQAGGLAKTAVTPVNGKIGVAVNPVVVE